MRAIIFTGGKQIILSVNDVIYVEKLVCEVGEKVEFDKVLLMGDLIGTPYVPNAKVIGIVEKQGKQPKIDVLRYQAKSNLRKRYGHRQPYTKIKILEFIGAN